MKLSQHLRTAHNMTANDASIVVAQEKFIKTGRSEKGRRGFRCKVDEYLLLFAFIDNHQFI